MFLVCYLLLLHKKYIIINNVDAATKNCFVFSVAISLKLSTFGFDWVLALSNQWQTASFLISQTIKMRQILQINKHLIDINISSF